MIRRQVGVDHCRLNVRVAHQLLDGGQIDALHDQVAGEGVAESVQLGQVFNPGFSCNLDQLLPQFHSYSAAILVSKNESAFQTRFVSVFQFLE